MRSTNPACYECPRDPGGIHTWRWLPYSGGRAVCKKCGKELNPQDAAEVFDDSVGQGREEGS